MAAQRHEAAKHAAERHYESDDYAHNKLPDIRLPDPGIQAVPCVRLERGNGSRASFAQARLSIVHAAEPEQDAFA
jgi:hypothetical protein